MGVSGSMVGANGGAGGTGFKGAGLAPVQAPTNANQVGQSTVGANNSLASQNALLAALQNQNGLGQQNAAGQQQQTLASNIGSENGAANQINAYNQQQNLNVALNSANGVGYQQNALAQQQGLNNQLANGVNTQNAAVSGLQGVSAQQQALAAQQANTAAQYQNIANGTGPNPAQAMLNQSTGQNVQNQAALMAGQRGAGSNVGLMAREAAQQGAATQQQAVGQGASMQAQQQIAGLQGLSAQQAAIGNTAQQQAATQQAIGGLGSTQAGMQQTGISQMTNAGQSLTAQQQAGLNQQAALAQNQIANQLGANAQVAGQANTVAGQQIGQTVAGTQAAQNEQAQQMNALNSYNTANIQNQDSVNKANTSLATTSMQGQQGVVGGGINAAGAIGGALLAAAARGGEVKRKHMDSGGVAGTMGTEGTGQVAPAVAPLPGSSASAAAPQSSFGKYIQAGLANIGGNGTPNSSGYTGGFQMGNKSINNGLTNLGKGIATAIKSKPGDDEEDEEMAGPDTPEVSPPGEMDSGLETALGARGGLSGKGGKVSPKKTSQKAVKKGNSYDNDKVPAMLSEGEIVLPRSVTMGKDPLKSSVNFVAEILAKRRKGK